MNNLCEQFHSLSVEPSTFKQLHDHLTRLKFNEINRDEVTLAFKSLISYFNTNKQQLANYDHTVIYRCELQNQRCWLYFDVCQYVLPNKENGYIDVYEYETGRSIGFYCQADGHTYMLLIDIIGV
jgi:hypothetical protein